MATLREILNHLSWMSPSLGLAIVSGLVVALFYMVLASRSLWGLPGYWFLGISGFTVGQILAFFEGVVWLEVGDLALGTGLVACIVLFTLLHVIMVWYTRGHRKKSGVPTQTLWREKKLHR